MAIGGVQEPHRLAIRPVGNVDARLAILVRLSAAYVAAAHDVAEDKHTVVPVLLATAVYGGNGRA
jgi:hypothetical protein